MGSASRHGARPRTKPSNGCSGTTERDCTRRWPMLARCDSSKTGLRLRPSEPIRDPVMGYGFQGQGQVRRSSPGSETHGVGVGSTVDRLHQLFLSIRLANRCMLFQQIVGQLALVVVPQLVPLKSHGVQYLKP